MTKVRLVWNNLWRKGQLGATGLTSEHPGYPQTETQVDSPQQPWRTRHGDGSGNGYFLVTDSNKYIDFDEGGAELTATLTPGAYNGQTLATEIKTQLDAAGALTYTVTYSETAAKFTIAAPSNFTLRWNTGTHKANDISDLAGFSDAADDTGAATYTSDYRRIHHPLESTGWLDTGTAQEVDFVALLGHNIPSGATIQLLGADDSGGTNTVTRTITWNATNIYQFVTALTKRWWRLVVYAPDSAASYIQVGTIVIGKAWEPNRSFSKDWAWGPQDASEVELSDAQVALAQEKLAPYVGSFAFEGLDDSSRAQALALISDAGCGVKYGFVLCMDYNTPNGNTWFVRNEEVVQPVYKHLNNWGWGLVVRELL